MKTMGKIITGVLIVSVIYIYIQNTKKRVTKEICAQTDEIDKINFGQQYNTIIEEGNQEKINFGQQFNTIIEENGNQENMKIIDESNELICEETDLDLLIDVSSPVSQDNELTCLSVIELKDLARVQQIKGYSRMKKAELIQILS